MTKKVSLVGRKRTKDLQASTDKMDLTKQTLLEMQEKEDLTAEPESVLGTEEVQSSLLLNDIPQERHPDDAQHPSGPTLSNIDSSSRGSQVLGALDDKKAIQEPAKAEQVAAPTQAPTQEIAKVAPVAQDPRPSVRKDDTESDTNTTTKSKAASSSEQFEADAVKYLLSVYKKLSGSSGNRYDFSPYQKHKKMVHYFKKVVNARAEVHAAEDMPFEQNQALCQRFVQNITERLNASGIELRPLVVVPE